VAFFASLLVGRGYEWLICLGGIWCAATTMLDADLLMASHARGGKLLSESSQWLGGNLTFGAGNLLTAIANSINYGWLSILLIGAMWLEFPCGRRSKLIGIFLIILIAEDMLRPLVNSVGMAWGFTMFFALCIFRETTWRFITDYRMEPLLRLSCYLLPAWLLFGQCIASAYNCGLLPKEHGWKFDAKETIHAQGWSNLFIMRGDSCFDLEVTNRPSYASFTTRINDAFNLLKDCPLNQKIIITMDMANAFPMMTHTKWPKREPIWLDYQNTFDMSNHIEPELVFYGADVVLVPKLSNNPNTEIGILSVYDAYMESHYTILEQDQYWYLLVKK